MYIAAQWSPRPDIIAAVVRVNEELVPWSWLLNRDELVLLNPNGKVLRSLFRPPSRGIAEIVGLAWSPDGRFLLCQVKDVLLPDGTASTRLWLADTAVGSIWEIQAPQLPLSTRLSISPNGDKIAGRGFLWDVASGIVQRFADDRLIAFSPQGMEAVLANNVLYISDGPAGLRPLYSGSQQPPIHLEDPTWSPDGSLLAVSVRYADDAFHNEIVILRPTGGLPYILSTGLPIASLSWSPDGTELLGITATFLPRRLVRLPLPAGLGSGAAVRPEGLPAPDKQVQGITLPKWLPEDMPLEPLVQRYPQPSQPGRSSPWAGPDPHITLIYSTAFTRSLEIEQYSNIPSWWHDAPDIYLGAQEVPVPIAGAVSYMATLERGYPPRNLGGAEATLLEGRARVHLGDLYLVVRWRGLAPHEVVTLMASMV
jgi:dipeptidyl aminopeptidase/acylaminoacyl peptidase